MKKGQKLIWRFSCCGRDQYHGCFHADFDGVCIYYYGSRRKYKSKEDAEKAGKRHEEKCRFRGTTTVWSKYE